jgi:amino acid transporter
VSSDSAGVVAGQPHIEAHDPHHRPEPDLVDKGLQHDSVGLLASVLLSVSSVAPAYALTATLGLTVTEVGVQAPAIFLVGFVPMLLAASAYRELNKVAPDAGTSFTWTVKAFGPHAGWMCGWGLVVAIIIVLSNLAGVAVTFFYLFLSEVVGDADVATWGDAGTGEQGVGLGNPETSDNVFAALADPVLGGTLSLLLFLAVLASSASSLQTTFIPAARTVLAMSTYKALPGALAKIHPVHRIPSYATLLSGVGTAIFYAAMTLVSENVLVDTILSLGLMICFYYGLTAFAAAWYFRREITRSVRDLLLKGIAPVLGGLTLAAVFVKLAIDTADPEYGSGGSILGLGTVFVLGIGTLLLGVLVMLAWQARSGAFFRGETLKHDTPALIVEE